MSDEIYVRGHGSIKTGAVGGASNNPGNTPQEPDILTKTIMWLKDDWMMKIGALFVLMSIGWFAKYAFDNGWVSEQMSIAIGMGVGLLIMFGGYYWSGKHKAQGAVLLALGSASIISVIYAGRELYGFFTPMTALLMIFAVVVFTVLSAMKFNERALATLAVVMSALAPILAGTMSTSFYSTFAYLFMLSAGSLWVVYVMQWRELVLENMLLVFLYSFPFWFGYYNELIGVNELIFTFAFSALFFVASIVGILRSNKDSDHIMELIVAFGTGLFIFIWTQIAAPEQLQTFVMLAWSLIFGLGSYSVYMGSNRLAPFAIYGGVAVMMLVFATALQFSGAAFAIAVSAEVSFITISSALLTRQRSVATITSFLFVVPIFITLPYIFSSEWSNSATFDGAIALYSLVTMMILTAVVIIKALPLSADAEVTDITMPKVLLAISGAYLSILIWLVPQALFTAQMAIATSLIIYTLFGISIYVLAQGKYEEFMHRLGQIILIAVVLRVLLVDLVNLGTAGRILVFAILGTALISTAFVVKSRSQTNESK